MKGSSTLNEAQDPFVKAIPFDSRSLLRRQMLLLACMYLGYAGFLLLKTSIVVAGPALLADPSLGLTKADWGVILGCGTIGGILGKFVSGWSADRVGGKLIFTAGLLVTTLGVSGFSFRSDFLAFALMYFIVLLANASGWPSMAKLIGNWFSTNQYGRVWGLISTSSRVGTITATLTVGALLRSMDWRQMLLVSAGIGTGLVLMATFLIRENPPVSPDTTLDNTDDPHIDHPFYQTTLKEAFFEFLGSKRFLLICGSMMGLTILWDFLNFVPLYLNERMGLSTADSAMATSSFPIGSLVSVLIGGFLFDKLSRKAVARLMTVYLGVAVASLGFILILPQIEFSLQGNLIATLCALFIFGFSVSPAYYLPMSIFSIEYGGPHSGFLIALLDAVGFAASVVFSFVGGRVAGQGGGWVAFLTLLIGVAVFSWWMTAWFLHGESKLQK
jgi:OPA family sugar phosphate sensor protein UhpC-like MFS transporter